jgi:hypothetical protein
LGQPLENTDPVLLQMGRLRHRRGVTCPRSHSKSVRGWVLPQASGLLGLFLLVPFFLFSLAVGGLDVLVNKSQTSPNQFVSSKFFVRFLAMVGIEPRALGTLGKHPTTEPHPQP